MGVDAARYNYLTRGIDDPPRANRGETARRTDCRDVLAGDPDIGGLGARGQNGKTARDHDVQHMSLPMMVITPLP
jgi:hypothetical protein